MVIEPTGSLLDLARTAPSVDIERLAPPGTVLVVVPHPDDESFGCGAALAAAAHAGRRIALILLTDGEGSHPRSRDYPPGRLKGLRLEELHRALQHLAARTDISIERLALHDGRTSITDLNYVDLERLERFARDCGVSVIWSTWQGDPHCDHVTASALAERLAARLGVPSWSFAVWGRFGERAVEGLEPRQFEAGDHRDAKRLAVGSYRSQTTDLIADDPAGFVMPAALIDHFIESPELFLERC